jgi:photosystem II stability/assembly factor-like uncharacterized protein
MTEDVLRRRLRSELESRIGPHPDWLDAPAAVRAGTPRRPAVRLVLVAALLAGAGFVAALVAGGGLDRRPAIVPSPSPTSSASPRVVIALPTHRDLSSYPAALLVGRLVFDGSCVWIDDTAGGRHLPIWPGGYTLRAADEAIRVYGPDGRTFTPIGGSIALGGGEYHEGADYAYLRTLMDADVAAACRGRDYWLVSPPQTVTGATPEPPPTPGPVEVAAVGLLDRQDGWALVVRLDTGVETGRDLLLTSDGGATWSVRPWPFGHSDGPFFSAFDVGWYLGPVLNWTADAGRAWSPVVLPAHVGIPELPVFLPDGTGYLLTSNGSYVGRPGPGGTLLVTTDRGATWTRRSDLPTGATGGLQVLTDRDMLLRGSTTGVENGHPALDVLMTSHDGGRSWELAPLPDRDVSITVLGEGAAVMVVTHGDGPTDFQLTTDGGRSWTTTGTIPGFIAAFSPVDRSTWYGELRSSRGVETVLSRTSDAGRTWSAVTTQGLPDGAAIRWLRLADADHGWAMVDVDAGPAGFVPSGLYATADGGLTWRRLTPGE